MLNDEFMAGLVGLVPACLLQSHSLQCVCARVATIAVLSCLSLGFCAHFLQLLWFRLLQVKIVSKSKLQYFLCHFLKTNILKGSLRYDVILFISRCPDILHHT